MRTISAEISPAEMVQDGSASRVVTEATLVPVQGIPRLARRLGGRIARARRLEDILHTVHLFGAAGITAFGWAVCRLLGVPSEPWAPLWFLSALLVYNVDRLRRDPADALNIPHRAQRQSGLRWLSVLLAIGSAALLVGLPILERDWLTLCLVLVGAPVCLHYSIPWRGKRLKDVPYLKTFFAPSLVVVAVFALPMLHAPLQFNLLATPLVASWAWGVLFCNMLLCDVRDIAGDCRTGVVSLPSHLGLPRTRTLIWAMAAVTGGIAAVMILLSDKPARGTWLALSLFLPVYLGALAVAVSWPRSERFYERWVEGILFVPALLVAFLL